MHKEDGLVRFRSGPSFNGSGKEGEPVKVEAHQLVALGTLCARLRFLLYWFERESALLGDCWVGASNLLLPAACLSRVETNASVADLYGEQMWCSPAAEYDELQSKLLDDYMFVLTRFHFVWTAYETIRSKSSAGDLLTSEDPSGRVEMSERVPTAQLESLERVFRTSLRLAQMDEAICNPSKIRAEPLVVGKAGRLAGQFRNYIFHGNEAPPIPEESDDPFRVPLDGDGVVSLKAYRVMTFTKLTLQLIQILTHADLHRRREVQWGDVPFLTWDGDCDFTVPSCLLLSLATCWPEKASAGLSRKVIEHLATGCGVSRETLERVTAIAVGIACESETDSR